MKKTILKFSVILFLLMSCKKKDAPEPTKVDPTSGTFTDVRDGNVYKWLKIGDQVWMIENLRYLPSITSSTYGSSTSPYYYVSQQWGTDVNAAKASAAYSKYGVLYNWPAAMNNSASSSSNPSGVQGVAPAGWHIPSRDELTQLVNYLGGENVAGAKLREVGTLNWRSPNTGATNESGFTAIPGGWRDPDGTIYNETSNFIIWSSTELNSTNAYGLRLYYNDNRALISGDFRTKDNGYSIRCIKD